jgi:GNAT superfamily N-acetyltransferase
LAGRTARRYNPFVRLEPFDARTADDATAAAYAALLADSRVPSTPEGLRLPAAYVLNRLRHFSPEHVVRIVVAWSDDGAPVGAVEVFWWDGPDNRDKAWVHLDYRAFDAGVVAPLMAAAASVASAAGRTVLVTEVVAGSPMRDWLAAHGGRLGSAEEHNVLRLRDVARADLDALAGAVPEGYSLLHLDGPTPDELVEPYVRLVHAMNDAPRDDLSLEDFVFTPERLRNWEAGLAARGHRHLTAFARHDASGELAAFNQLVVRPEWPESVENEDTAVARDHRGHGLGLCVKAANLVRLLDEHPEAECVETWNAASNAHMLRVNRRLGFVCEHRWESWEVPAALVASEPQPA